MQLQGFIISIPTGVTKNIITESRQTSLVVGDSRWEAGQTGTGNKTREESMFGKSNVRCLVHRQFLNDYQYKSHCKFKPHFWQWNETLFFFLHYLNLILLSGIPNVLSISPLLNYIIFMKIINEICSISGINSESHQYVMLHSYSHNICCLLFLL